MAISFSNMVRENAGSEVKVTALMATTGNYATNGYSISPAAVGLNSITRVKAQPSGGYVFDYDVSSGKVKVFSAGADTHSHAFGTLVNGAVTAGTPAGTNGSSSVTPFLMSANVQAISTPTIALTHAADPTGGGSDGALYALPHGGLTGGQARLESAQASTAATTFSTSNDGVYFNTGSARAYGHVSHSASPTGVAIFVDEADSDKLKADFTGAGSAGNKHVPLRMDAGIIFLKIIDADTSGMKALYYDDNGADNAKLVFLDAGGTGGTVHTDNIGVGAFGTAQILSGVQTGVAAAQTFTGSALATHNHTISGNTNSVATQPADEYDNGVALTLSGVEVEIYGKG